MANDSLASVRLDTRLAQGGRTPNTVDAKSTSGKTLPPDGTRAPQPAPADVPKIDISNAIQSINMFLQENQRGLRFAVDKASGRTVITVIDPVSGDIVRQIPPQEVLDIARDLRSAGVLLNAHA
jgi:flagellar protein FlaG